MTKQQMLLRNQALSAARAVAQGFVRECFPDMQGIEPRVSARTCQPTRATNTRPSPVAPAERAAGYVFTFSREVRTAEGYTLSRVARVTVDANQHVVKAIMSK